MTSQHKLDQSDSGESSIMSGFSKWNASRASGNPVQMDSRFNPTETQTKGRRRVFIAFWIFLAVLMALSGAVTYMLWAKLKGSM